MVKNQLVFPDVEDSIFYIVLGLILSVLSCGTVFLLFYSYFFCRRNYFNRKALFKYLQHNPLPEHETIAAYLTYNFDNNIVLTHSISSDNTWYVFQGSSIKISSYHFGLGDSYRYKKILKLLQDQK